MSCPKNDNFGCFWKKGLAVSVGDVQDSGRIRHNFANRTSTVVEGGCSAVEEHRTTGQDYCRSHLVFITHAFWDHPIVQLLSVCICGGACPRKSVGAHQACCATFNQSRVLSAAQVMLCGGAATGICAVPFLLLLAIAGNVGSTGLKDCRSPAATVRRCQAREACGPDRSAVTSCGLRRAGPHPASPLPQQKHKNAPLSLFSVWGVGWCGMCEFTSDGDVLWFRLAANWKPLVMSFSSDCHLKVEAVTC